ncbi:hypothetical protein DFH27DRAFT_610487 [Peziza echinospora]|nr:hypothetical protein DFH27DRAFT_610487 [Peziza echinospora]
MAKSKTTTAEAAHASAPTDAAFALMKHPAHLRAFITQIPQTLLSTLLTHHIAAYQPKSIIITSLKPSGLSVSYLQPVEDICFAPVPRSATIPFRPELSPIPAEDAPRSEVFTWEEECAARLRDMESAALTILEGRSDIAVLRYVPPTSPASYLAAAQFVLLSVFIVMWIFRGRDLPFVGPFIADNIFNVEWKFNATAIFHAAILVKRWGDVLSMAKKLRLYNVDKLGVGKVGGARMRGPWIQWIVTAFFEGWRCERRFDEEVARVGRAMAAEQDSKSEEAKKTK